MTAKTKYRIYCVLGLIFGLVFVAVRLGFLIVICRLAQMHHLLR